LLRLPRLQSFQQSLVHVAGLSDLPGESRWVACKIKGFGGDHTGSLVVAMIFPNEESGKPGDNHTGPRDSNHPNHVLQSLAMMPVRERLQDILAGSITAA